MPKPSKATKDPHSGQWLDGQGNPLGPGGLAQLGKGGQWVHPETGKTMTIVDVQTIPSPSGGTYTAVISQG